MNIGTSVKLKLIEKKVKGRLLSFSERTQKHPIVKM